MDSVKMVPLATSLSGPGKAKHIPGGTTPNHGCSRGFVCTLIRLPSPQASPQSQSDGATVPGTFDQFAAIETLAR